MEHVNSVSDERTANNGARHQYRILSENEKVTVTAIKDLGQDLLNYLDTISPSREVSLAKTKVEEAIMWAVKGVTK